MNGIFLCLSQLLVETDVFTGKGKANFIQELKRRKISNGSNKRI